MSKEDSRHNARVIALEKLFERSFSSFELNQSKSDLFTEDTLLEVSDISNYDKDLVDKLVTGVVETQKELDKIIQDLAPAWPLDQIAKLDLQILRIAVYEGFIGKITPPKVAINEAIELAREFSNEQSRKFINGVLGTLIEKNQITTVNE